MGLERAMRVSSITVSAAITTIGAGVLVARTPAPSLDSAVASIDRTVAGDQSHIVLSQSKRPPLTQLSVDLLNLDHIPATGFKPYSQTLPLPFGEHLAVATGAA